MIPSRNTFCPREWGIDFDRLSHTYIIEGNSFSQIRNAANSLAAAILCEAGDKRPCGYCSACLLTDSANNPDLVTVELPKDKKSIGADEARAMIQDVYVKPFRSKYKVYLLPLGDKLTDAGQNTMLKVLEEPPPYAVFILCVTNGESLLETIHSRAIHIRLKAEDGSGLSTMVVQNYPNYAASAEFIAKYCGGVAARAEELCTSGAMELRNRMCGLLYKVIDRRASDLFTVSAFFAEEEVKPHISQLLEFAQLFFRDALTLSVTGDVNLIINVDLKDELKKLCTSLTPSFLANALQVCGRARQMADRYVNNKALILNMLIKIWENGDFE